MKALVFDTETTGLIDNHSRRLSDQPEITEIYLGLADLDNGQVSGEFDQLLKPRKHSSRKVTGITGITEKMLADMPSFAFYADQIRAMIEEAPAVLAHNLSFDMEIVDLEFERIDQPTPKWPDRKICTVEQTCHMIGRRISQMDLHELLFDEKFDEAHRAGPDTKALIRIATELNKRGLL